MSHVHTETPIRYPPGYSGHAYNCGIPHPILTIRYDEFSPNPRHNAQDLDNIFARVMRFYGDPVDKDKIMRSSMQGLQEAWSEGDDSTRESRLIVWVPSIIPGQSADLTYG